MGQLKGGPTNGKTGVEDTGGGAIGRRRRAAQTTGGEEYHAKRREVIHVAATVFQEKGYQAATLHDVAVALHTDRATLYYYVSGKEELLREAVARYVIEILDDVRRIAVSEAPAPAKLRQLITLLMTAYESHYPHPYVFIQEKLDETWRDHPDWADQLVTLVNEVQTLVMGILEQGISDGDFRPDLPVDLIRNAMLGMINWTHRWFAPGGRYTGEQVGLCFAGLLLDGLLVDGLADQDS